MPKEFKLIEQTQNLRKRVKVKHFEEEVIDNREIWK